MAQSPSPPPFGFDTVILLQVSRSRFVYYHLPTVLVLSPGFCAHLFSMAGPLLAPALLLTLENAIEDANATRWFSGEWSLHFQVSYVLLIEYIAAGLTLLLYDHIMTLPDEMALIWRSPPSFSKYAFLFNRYLVPIVLTFITVELCGFSGLFFSDRVSFKYYVSCVVVLTSRDHDVQECVINLVS